MWWWEWKPRRCDSAGPSQTLGVCRSWITSNSQTSHAHFQTYPCGETCTSSAGLKLLLVFLLLLLLPLFSFPLLLCMAHALLRGIEQEPKAPHPLLTANFSWSLKTQYSIQSEHGISSNWLKTIASSQSCNHPPALIPCWPIFLSHFSAQPSPLPYFCQPCLPFCCLHFLPLLCSFLFSSSLSALVS